MRCVSRASMIFWVGVGVWESSQKLTSRGSIGDVNEEIPYENGRSLHKVSESSDLDA